MDPIIGPPGRLKRVEHMDACLAPALSCISLARVERSSVHETNILPRIPGQYLASTSLGLPDAATTNEREVHATMEVPGHGKVLIIFERMTHKRGKSSHTWWSPKHAQVLND
jgi:hypothetical protein